ncbi:DUF4226 domain-containing protein [Mycobacterium sp. HUMS_1102779]|uniref:DUF4226 domain-containing protein n=1 Tax=Mycobacterium sp. HUMS_1102779 TaxID=3383487 RepID=UPI00389A8719
MSEQAGPSVAALRAGQAALAGRHATAADADRVLADVLAGVHAATRESIRRLDAIAAEVDRAVLDRAALAADTPLGAREFHNFLVAKLREIRAVVADADELGRAKRAVLERLRAQYVAPVG